MRTLTILCALVAGAVLAVDVWHGPDVWQGVGSAQRVTDIYTRINANMGWLSNRCDQVTNALASRGYVDGCTNPLASRGYVASTYVNKHGDTIDGMVCINSTDGGGSPTLCIGDETLARLRFAYSGNLATDMWLGELGTFDGDPDKRFGSINSAGTGWAPFHCDLGGDPDSALPRKLFDRHLHYSETEWEFALSNWGGFADFKVQLNDEGSTWIRFPYCVTNGVRVWPRISSAPVADEAFGAYGMAWHVEPPYLSDHAATKAYVDAATNPLASRAYVDGCTNPLASRAYVNGCTNPLASRAYVDGCTNPLASRAYVDGCTNPLASRAYVDEKTASMSAYPNWYASFDTDTRVFTSSLARINCGNSSDASMVTNLIYTEGFGYYHPANALLLLRTRSKSTQYDVPGNVSVSGSRIIEVGSPVSPADAATKDYADSCTNWLASRAYVDAVSNAGAAAYVRKSGDTMTGLLVTPSNHVMRGIAIGNVPVPDELGAMNAGFNEGGTMTANGFGAQNAGYSDGGTMTANGFGSQNAGYNSGTMVALDWGSMNRGAVNSGFLITNTGIGTIALHDGVGNIQATNDACIILGAGHTSRPREIVADQAVLRNEPSVPQHAATRSYVDTQWRAVGLAHAPYQMPPGLGYVSGYSYHAPYPQCNGLAIFADASSTVDVRYTVCHSQTTPGLTPTNALNVRTVMKNGTFTDNSIDYISSVHSGGNVMTQLVRSAIVVSNVWYPIIYSVNPLSQWTSVVTSIEWRYTP